MSVSLLFSALALTIVGISATNDTLFPGKPLPDGEYLISSDGTFKLGFFTPERSNSSRYLGIWYNRIPILTAVWVANRNNPLPDKTGALSVSFNGSLSIADSRRRIYWSTPPVNYFGGTAAKLFSDGNFVVSGAVEYTWQSFDHPTDTMLPGMIVGVMRRTRTAKNLTSWKSAADPADGDFTLFPDTRGDPQVFLMNGMEKLWRSGPWTGERFSGVPQMESYDDFNLTFVAEGNEGYYKFDVRNNAVLSRLVVHYSGEAQRLVWLETEGEWRKYWSALRDNCDRFGFCGENSVCDASASPLCSCLRGFQPNSPENWNFRETKEGCGRRAQLNCKTDGFVKVGNTKIPDTSEVMVSSKMGVDECRDACTRNCSCTAYSAAEIINGRVFGCILWSGPLKDITVYDSGEHDLFVRVAYADLDTPPETKRKKKIIWVAIVVPCFAAVLLLGLVIWFLQRRRRRNIEHVRPSMRSHMSMEKRSRHEELDLPLFDLADIVYATNNFSSKNKLGEGGFGPVYKGVLGGEQEIAVKRLGKRSSQGLDEFMNEVRVIAKLQHRNLVRLLGCCIDGEERILVYEFMPNGSLDSVVFDKQKTSTLDWDTKLQIIGGIARGLLYLHQDSRLRIIHRDLKTGNVLLDARMNPKISDFGMARVFAGDETQGITRRVVGTYGYMAPEYAMDGSFSVKSDVFSFGIIVLEIISGRKNRAVFAAENHLNLLSEAWSLWLEGKELNLLATLDGTVIPAAEVRKYIKIGLLCVQEMPQDRPEMAAIVVMLDRDMAALAHPKPPGFITARERAEVSSNSRNTVNDVTITVPSAR